MSDDIRTALALKRTGQNTIEGLAIPFGGLFGGKDVDGEAFTPDTDFCLDWFGKSGRPLLYDHGLDNAMATSVTGRQTDYEVREEGIWAQSQLDANARYRKAIDKLLDESALGYSSGSMPHLAKKSGHLITRWPWVELSMTPFPAAGPLSTVHYIKSAALIEHLTAIEQAIPAELVASAMKALDDGDDALPDGAKFADLLDRLSVDGSAWTKARKDWYAKSGRVLSSATRERLMTHPRALRHLADDLDELLESTDSDKREAGKTALLWAALEAELSTNPLAPRLPA